MTEAAKKYALITVIALVLIGIFVFVYIKWIRPKADKAKEQKRVVDTNIITSAQTESKDNVARGVPTTNPAVVAPVGIGGVIAVENTRQSNPAIDGIDTSGAVPLV